MKIDLSIVLAVFLAGTLTAAMALPISSSKNTKILTSWTSYGIPLELTIDVVPNSFGNIGMLKFRTPKNAHKDPRACAKTMKRVFNTKIICAHDGTAYYNFAVPGNIFPLDP